MSVSGNTSRFSVNVQRIRRYSLRTVQSKTRSINVIHVKVHSANSQSSTVRTSCNEFDDSSSINVDFNHSPRNSDENSGKQSTVLQTGSCKSSVDKLTPLNPTKYTFNDRTHSPINEDKKKRRSASELNNESERKKNKRFRRSGLWWCLVCALPCLLLTLIFAIALPIILSKSSSTTTIASTTTTITTTTATTTTTTTVTTATTTTTTISTTTTTTTASTTTTTTTDTTSTTSSTTSVTTTTTTVTTETTTVTTSSTSVTTTTTTVTTETTTTTISTTTITTSETTTTTATSTTSVTSSTTSITTTATITTTTTTVPWDNPCSGGTLWNTTGVIYAGNAINGSALNQLCAPTGLYMDPHNTLYITDSGNYRIMVYNYNEKNGTMVAGTGVQGSSLSQLNSGARYLFVDSNQNVYVSDQVNQRVIRWKIGNSTGTLAAGNGAGGSTSSQINYPYGMWIDSNSNLYVAEYNNHRVTKWVSGSSVGVIVAGTGIGGNSVTQLNGPTGFFYDEANNDLYISNNIASTVMRWKVGASSGTIVAGTLGSSGSSASQLKGPTGIIVDPWKNIYINDRDNNRVQLYCNGSSSGITIVGASTGGQSLGYPYAIQLDSDHNLYVAEYYAARVTKFNKL